MLERIKLAFTFTFFLVAIFVIATSCITGLNAIIFNQLPIADRETFGRVIAVGSVAVFLIIFIGDFFLSEE